MLTNRRQQIRLSPDEQAAFFRERNGAFYMTSYGKAQKVVNIRGNPKVALLIEAGEILEDEGSVRAAFEAQARGARPILTATSALTSRQ